MSHFTVLVVGDNPEDQLKPFDENLRTEFEDKKDEYKEEYDTTSCSEFYGESNSSWGQQITKELYNLLQTSKAGRITIYTVDKGMDIGSYYKRGGKYRGYYTLKSGKRCKGSQWFEVTDVLKTDHPDQSLCFEGEIRIRKIKAPRQIQFKTKYPIYEDYLKDWHGVNDLEKQGYDFNPQAKWDWYQLGGRWAGFFKLKPLTKGVSGELSWTREDNPPEAGTADQAQKKDIDFDQMREDNFEEACSTYDEFKEKLDAGDMTPSDGYFRYGIENKGDRDNYDPETRDEYVARCSDVSTFAVLKDGKWYEKGEMGWWACISNEKDPQEWISEFAKLIKKLPDDTLLSLYDCHV